MFYYFKCPWNWNTIKKRLMQLWRQTEFSLVTQLISTMLHLMAWFFEFVFTFHEAHFDHFNWNSASLNNFKIYSLVLSFSSNNLTKSFPLTRFLEDHNNTYTQQSNSGSPNIFIWKRPYSFGMRFNLNNGHLTGLMMFLNKNKVP